MPDVEEVIEKRQSIRRYKPDPVPEEMILRILRAAWLAPSGVNRQPWRFLVATDPKERQRLQEFAYGQQSIGEAPVVFVCCADLSIYSPEAQRAERDQMLRAVAGQNLSQAAVLSREQAIREAQDPAYPMQQVLLNCAIAIEHMVLTATSLGLGSCWVRRFDRLGVREFLGLPENIAVLVLLPVGFAAEAPPRRPRIPFEQILLRPLQLDA